MAEAHWHVLGAGAIGCLFAAALARSGSGVTLVTRGHSGRRRLRIEDSGATTEVELPVCGLHDAGQIATLLVTTKAYDVVDAVAAVAPRLADDANVLLLVNGMGLAQELRSRHPRLQVYSGTTTQGAYRRDPTHICHAGHGDTLIGRPGQAEPPPWFGQWVRAVPRCRWESEIEAALWSKLAVNCVINPLTALHGCRNGELALRAELRAEVEALCREVTQVSYAAGYTQTAQTIGDSVARVIAGTADNRSSMLQDVSAGRPTEIDYITGYLLRIAEEHGIPAQRNRAIFEEVKAIAH